MYQPQVAGLGHAAAETSRDPRRRRTCIRVLPFGLALIGVPVQGRACARACDVVRVLGSACMVVFFAVYQV
jgi:hypothetical protein